MTARLSCGLAGVFLSLAMLASTFDTATAGEVTKECRAVQNVATITLSSKLLYSIASDTGKQSCQFFVSLPPPYSIRDSVDAWYKTRASNFGLLTKIVADLAVAPIESRVPKSPDDADLIKAVQLRINNNSDLITTCVTKLFDKLSFEGKSKDEQVSCDTSAALEQAVVTVLVGDNFVSTVALPRPPGSA
jgi:hypothetical protein